MARPREFDEKAVLDTAMECFWRRGYEATSMRDLIEKTGITGASLYNAFGDKRALFVKTLERYVDDSVADRIRRCEALPPREAIEAFFSEVLRRSLEDPERKGCMLVNTRLDAAPHDGAFRKNVAAVLVRIEMFSWAERGGSGRYNHRINAAGRGSGAASPERSDGIARARARATGVGAAQGSCSDGPCFARFSKEWEG
jgi:AcrR family transcriptional regulator